MRKTLIVHPWPSHTPDVHVPPTGASTRTHAIHVYPSPKETSEARRISLSNHYLVDIENHIMTGNSGWHKALSKSTAWCGDVLLASSYADSYRGSSYTLARWPRLGEGCRERWPSA